MVISTNKLGIELYSWLQQFLYNVSVSFTPLVCLHWPDVPYTEKEFQTAKKIFALNMSTNIEWSLQNNSDYLTSNRVNGHNTIRYLDKYIKPNPICYQHK